MSPIALALAVSVSSASAQSVQERVDLSVFARIRDEGLNRSQIEPLARQLIDGIGPRLTGSTGMRRANDWTAQRFREWGLTNVVVEPWGQFGRGWDNVSFAGRVVSPYTAPINAIPLAWTGSTSGTLTSRVVLVKGGVEELKRSAGTLRGVVVMMAPPTTTVPPSAQAPFRTSVDSLVGRPALAPSQAIAWDKLLGDLQAQDAKRDTALRNAGVAAVLTPSGRQFGLVDGAGNWWGPVDVRGPEPVPELLVQQEQYARMYRLLDAGTPVSVELNIQNRFSTADLQAYNTLADLRGTDKPDEYIMLGAHLDSWHAGTGATDNGAGSLVMIEAMRILKTLNLAPRRTVRLALWSGEEQGLYGSRRWVAKHPELHSKISAYVNVDNGTGKIRGIWNQSNEAAVGIFEQTLWPFRDLGVVAVRRGDTGGTDHLAFDEVGIPGFNFIQDPMGYGFWTHHTDVDTYEHLAIDDLKQAAVVVAATVYHLAMRDEMMPRKTARTTP